MPKYFTYVHKNLILMLNSKTTAVKKFLRTNECFGEAFNILKVCLTVPPWLSKWENLGDSSGIAQP